MRWLSRSAQSPRGCFQVSHCRSFWSSHWRYGLRFITHPIAETRTSWLELSVALLVVTSIIAFIITFSGSRDLVEFAKWLIATSMVFALLRLSRQELRLFGLVFVYGACLGAIFAMGIYFFDKSGRSLSLLSFIGYGGASFHDTNLRFYILGDSMVTRLTGTYIDPNGAGISMLIAVALAVALLRGWQRQIVVPVLLAALLITLTAEP